MWTVLGADLSRYKRSNFNVKNMSTIFCKNKNPTKDVFPMLKKSAFSRRALLFYVDLHGIK